MRAMDVERRLASKKLHQTQFDVSHTATSDVDETLVKCAIEYSVSNYDTSAAVDSLLDDNVSTLKEDELVKTDRDFEQMPTPEKPKDDDIDAKPKSSDIAPLFLNIDTNLNAYDAENLSPSFSLHSSPSLGALNESRNQSLYFTPMSGREAFSPSSSHGSQFPAPRLIRSNSYTLDKPSPMLLKHMEINGIHPGSTSSPLKSPMSLNEFRKNQNNNNNASSSIPRRSLGGNAKQLKPNHHLQVSLQKTPTGNNKLSPSMSNNSMNSTIISSNKSATKSSATKTTKGNTTSNTKQSNPISGMKNKEAVLRSIYGPSKPNKVQFSAKKVNGSAATTNVTKNSPKPTHQADPISLNTINGSLNAQNYGDILTMIEKQHAAQMEAMLKRQQEEQKRMHDEFLRQQEELLKTISCLVLKGGGKQSTPNQTAEKSADVSKKSIEKLLIDEVSNEVSVIFDANGNRVNRFTPPENSKCIRRLYYDENKLVASGIETDKSSLSSLSSSTSTSEQFEKFTTEEVRAASIIVAYTKGYLTRRLFRTSKVKDIRKTHYDTLVLLMDMCDETNENETKTDIELKFHLLQQVKYSLI